MVRVNAGGDAPPDPTSVGDVRGHSPFLVFFKKVQYKRVPTYQSGVETRQPFADDRHSPPTAKIKGYVIGTTDPSFYYGRPRHSEQPQRREAVYITHLLLLRRRRRRRRRLRHIVDCSHQSLSCRTRGIRVMSIDTNSWG